jgi:hypothetical protein
MRHSGRCARRSRWYGSGAFAIGGLAVAGAQVAGGQTTGQVAFTLVLFGAIAVGLQLGGGSESLRALRGDLADERLRAIELRAQALAGRLVILALVIAYLVELARGRSGAPFSWLTAIGGLTYLVAYLFGMRR